MESCPKRGAGLAIRTRYRGCEGGLGIGWVIDDGDLFLTSK